MSSVFLKEKRRSQNLKIVVRVKDLSEARWLFFCLQIEVNKFPHEFEFLLLFLPNVFFLWKIHPWPASVSMKNRNVGKRIFHNSVLPWATETDSNRSKSWNFIIRGNFFTLNGSEVESFNFTQICRLFQEQTIACRENCVQVCLVEVQSLPSVMLFVQRDLWLAGPRALKLCGQKSNTFKQINFNSG